MKNRFCMVLLHRGMCSCHKSIFFSEESKAGFYGRVSCQAMLRKARLTFIEVFIRKEGVVRKEFLVRICWIQFVNVPASEQNLECPWQNKGCLFCTASRFSQSIDPRGIPGVHRHAPTTTITRRLQWSCVYPAAHHHRGHGNGFWCFKTMEGWMGDIFRWEMVCDIAFSDLFHIL